MITPASKSEALWTTFKDTNKNARKKITDKAKEINDNKISRPIKIQKYQEAIALIEDVIERTETFLSDTKELVMSTQIMIRNEITGAETDLRIMKTLLAKLEEEEAEERDMEMEDWIDVKEGDCAL